MNAGSSMKPRKAQVKDKGLGAESGDFGLNALRFRRKNLTLCPNLRSERQIDEIAVKKLFPEDLIKIQFLDFFNKICLNEFFQNLYNFRVSHLALFCDFQNTQAAI